MAPNADMKLSSDFQGTWSETDSKTPHHALQDVRPFSVERVVYKAGDMVASPVEVPWEKQWMPSPPLEDVPEMERKPWMSTKIEPVLEMVDRQAAANPDKVAMTWINEKGKSNPVYTYAELCAKSHSIAQKLLSKWGYKSGDHVLLVYPPGPEFIVAFIACMRAGVVAVPVYPPAPSNLKGDMFKLMQIATDANTKGALTERSYKTVVTISKLRGVKWPVSQWHTTDDVKDVSIKSSPRYPPRASSIAFLQYTSGSTSEPKGVMVTHANIAHNTSCIRRQLRLDTSSVFFSWLPQYHDLGLIVAYLSTLSSGASGVYVSPITFIKNPPLWVMGMSEHKATHTACPNFALDLCVRKFKESEHAKPGFSLASLECMLNCAEPVRVDSIKRWNKAFSKFGWHPAAMSPAYGLAEHTVGLVAWGSKAVPAADGNGMLHSSGNFLCTVGQEGRMVFVNPGTLRECEPGEVGEIWVRSDSKTGGYWNKPELTQEQFHAKMVDNDDQEDFLRTGDLGFMVDNQLFICGRLKDLIIVRGRNYYPQDLEQTVQTAADFAVRPGCLAAFNLSDGPGQFQDQVAIVAELKTPDLSVPIASVLDTIRTAVSQTQGVDLARIALIQPRSIPKTTSGKIQRRRTRQKLMEGSLDVVKGGYFEDDGRQGKPGSALPATDSAEGVPEADEETDPFLILKMFGVVDLERDVLSQGLDSLRCMELLQYLKKHAGIELDASMLASVPARQLVDGTLQSTVLRLQRPSQEATPKGRALPWPVVYLLQLVGVLVAGLMLGAAIIPSYHFISWVTCSLGRPLSYISLDNDAGAARHSGGSAIKVYGLLIPLVVPVWMICFSVEVLLAKWVLLGRLQPGCHTMWSWFFLRWWFVDRLLYIWEEVVGVYCLDTVILNLFYKLGGARISWSAHMTAYIHEWDLITVGPGASVDGRLLGRLTSPGRLFLDRVVVGAHAEVDDHTVVQPGCNIGEHAQLQCQSVLLEGSTMDAHSTWSGNPAKLQTLKADTAAEPESDSEALKASAPNRFLFEASKLLIGLPLTSLLFTYCQIPIIALFEVARGAGHGPHGHSSWRYRTLAYFSVLFFGSIVVGTAVTIALKWILFGKVNPGKYRNTAWLQWRKWWLELNATVCRHNLLDMFESSFVVNIWIAALGGQIAASTKMLISYTIAPYEADLLYTEPDTFISESYVRCDDGEGYRQPVKFCRGSWTGLGAVIEPGCVIGEHSGVGAMTYVEGPSVALAGSDVMLFGNPPIVLPRRKLKQESDELKVSPWTLVAMHLVVLVQRLGILVLLTACVIPGLEFGRFIYHQDHWDLNVRILLWGWSILLIVFSLALSSIVIKWLSHGRFHPGPMKGAFTIGTYTTTDTLDNYMVFRFVFPFINGSFLATWFHRAMGGRIGNNVFMNPGSFRDHDIISVGDNAVLDECHVQGHKFEHGQIQFDVTVVGSGATLQPEAICIAGDMVEHSATLASLSKAFPSQPCASGYYWVGVPASRAITVDSRGNEVELDTVV